MILLLERLVKDISFNEAVSLSINDEQRYIRCTNFFSTTYIQIRREDNSLIFRFVEISENLDVLDEGPWEDRININDILDNNWSVYRATIG